MVFEVGEDIGFFVECEGGVDLDIGGVVSVSFVDFVV